jgi:hypothetical protein
VEEAEAGGERAERHEPPAAGRARFRNDEGPKPGWPMHGAFLSVRHGLAAAGWCVALRWREKEPYLVRISFPRAVCLRR